MAASDAMIIPLSRRSSCQRVVTAALAGCDLCCSSRCDRGSVAVTALRCIAWVCIGARETGV